MVPLEKAWCLLSGRGSSGGCVVPLEERGSSEGGVALLEGCTSSGRGVALLGCVVPLKRVQFFWRIHGQTA